MKCISSKLITEGDNESGFIFDAVIDRSEIETQEYLDFNCFCCFTDTDFIEIDIDKQTGHKYCICPHCGSRYNLTVKDIINE